MLNSERKGRHSKAEQFGTRFDEIRWRRKRKISDATVRACAPAGAPWVRELSEPSPWLVGSSGTRGVFFVRKLPQTTALRGARGPRWSRLREGPRSLPGTERNASSGPSRRDESESVKSFVVCPPVRELRVGFGFGPFGPGGRAPGVGNHVLYMFRTVSTRAFRNCHFYGDGTEGSRVGSKKPCLQIVGVQYFVRGGFVGHRSRASSKHLYSHLPVDGVRFLGGQKGLRCSCKMHVWVSGSPKISTAAESGYVTALALSYRTFLLRKV
ncbi:hypothetical protein TNCV_242431 [Trichonephila clavipes]|uniref:Uncharacterized protein n=1 Tax=Trichonephila clavipes TaxID=2585209 RepID=A0A8X6W4B8_TRICX|nr:hypothetical protein TNCV_242431 [Trichonephila clavipes]